MNNLLVSEKREKKNQCLSQETITATSVERPAADTLTHRHERAADFFTHTLRENPLVSAPLAGYSDLPFRLLCKDYGAGICYSEMISAHGLCRRQKSTTELLATCLKDRPVVMQLFGAEPEIMAEAAAILQELPIDGIDINMGCPVKKVVKKGAGAALLRQPKLAAAITNAVARVSRLPLSVKIRAGWDHQNINADRLAPMLADNGAMAICLHARTWSDGFSGKADHQITAQLSKKLSVPLIANGDIFSAAQAIGLMNKTGCSGVMIGRAALGAPWVFSADSGQDTSLEYRRQAAIHHLRLIVELRPYDNPARVRNHIGRYFKNTPGAITLRRLVFDHKGSINELLELLDSYK